MVVHGPFSDLQTNSFITQPSLMPTTLFCLPSPVFPRSFPCPAASGKSLLTFGIAISTSPKVSWLRYPWMSLRGPFPCDVFPLRSRFSLPDISNAVLSCMGRWLREVLGT